MRIRHYFILFILGILVAIPIASLEKWPGYMDADYYFAGGQRIAAGHGFSEIILWNYLDDPQGIPHPSHGYWMPMTSILTALGMMTFGNLSFNAGRIGFIIIAGAISVVTGALAYSFTSRKVSAYLAGILAALSGFYAPFLVTTDSFGLYALIGGLIMLVLGLYSKEETQKNKIRRYIAFMLLGLMAGIMHLTRTDGLLWFAVLAAMVLCNLVKVLFPTLSSRHEFQTDMRMRMRSIAADFLFLVSGYFLIITPWIYRNLLVFNSPLSSGGWRVLWLTNYDEIFIYPASELTITNWLASGFTDIVQARIWALGQNLQTTLAVQGMVFLLPLIIVGMWDYRQDLRVRVGGIIWLLIFIVMTFVLPFVGARGGFFHAGAALLPLFLAMVPIGLEKFIHWGERMRDWYPEKARIGFSTLIIVSALSFTVGIVYFRVVGSSPGEMVWGRSEEFYLRVDQNLIDYGIQPEEIVLVNNPPGYTAATGRAAIAIPDGDVNTLVDVAERYHATYIILESNHPRELDLLFTSPGDRGLIKYLGTFEDAHIYLIG